MRPTTDPSAERGAAAVELALVLPILIFLIFGIVEFGRGFNARLTVTHAAREGARAFAIAEGDDSAAIEEDVRDRVEAAIAPLTLADPDTQISIDAPCTPGEPAVVTVTYPLTFDVPLWQAGTWTITSTGSMRCAG